MSRRLLWGMGAVLCVPLVTGLILSSRRDGSAPTNGHDILGALDAAPAQAILFAGNSHADFAAAAAAQACGPIVDAGLPGIEAKAYAAFLTGLPVTPARARLAVLLIGTNDIRRHAKPMTQASLTRFRDDSRRILAWLRAHADMVLVAAVPPIRRDAQMWRDPDAVAAYSAVLRDLCTGPTCRFTDPFTALRADDTGFAREGTLADTVHLKDYADLVATLGLCPPRETASKSGSLRDTMR